MVLSLGMIWKHVELMTCIGTQQDTNIDVPQRAYIAPDGALSFTTLLELDPTGPVAGPQNMTEVPPGSIVDIQAYHHGYLQAPPGMLGWRACPVEPYTSDQRRYQVFAALPDVGINVDCFEITILTSDYLGEGPAAYVYA